MISSRPPWTGMRMMAANPDGVLMLSAGFEFGAFGIISGIIFIVWVICSYLNLNLTELPAGYDNACRLPDLRRLGCYYIP